MADADIELAQAKKLLASPRFSSRMRGLETLSSLGRKDLILAHAVEERDMRVLGFVEKCFTPKPKELVRHLCTGVRDCDSELWLRYRATQENYLYAEDTLYSVLAPKRELTIDAIDAIGLAYLRSCGQLLHKYLKGHMISYKTARALKGPRAVSGVPKLDASDGSDCWSRESAFAIQAALALTRLDLDFDLRQVERMLEEIPKAMNLPESGKARIGQLKWILFDKGVTNDLKDLSQYVRGGRPIGPDLALTLVKKRRFDELRRVVIDGVTYAKEGTILEYIGVVFTEPSFCYWPLIDWLEREKLYDSAKYSRHMAGYIKAREENQAPPPWWQWLDAASADQKES